MTMMLPRRLVPFVAIGVCALAGCRADLPSTNASVVPAAPPLAVLSLQAPVQRGDTALIEVRITAGEGAPIAAASAYIDYDTTALAVLDVSPAPGAVHAQSTIRGRLSLAVAHPTGFPSARLAAVRFVAHDPAALDRLTLQLRELRGHDGSDRRRDVPVAPRGVRMPEGR